MPMASPTEEHLDLEEDPNAWLPITASRKAKWYHSTVHNVTAMIGAGILALPHAMSKLGWGPGVVVLILSWFITLYTLWQMIEMHEMVSGRRFDRYHELGQAAFGQSLGLYIIVPQQLLVQISVCIVYMVTGGQSLKNIHDLLHPNKCKKMKIQYFILIFASTEFVLSQLKNFNSIAGVSLVATITSVSYSTIAWAASVSKGIQPHVEYRYTGDTEFHFFSALGKMAFAYAGHNVVMEIQATMPSTSERPSKGPMWKGAFTAYIVVAFCYFPVAIAGYLVFGNKVQENILKNLHDIEPNHSFRAVTIVANMCVFIHLIGSYQVYAMPVFDIIECVTIQLWQFDPTKTLRFILRSTFVAATMGVAVALPYFGELLSFFGGLVFVPTTYFIPCIIWLKLRSPRRFSLSWWTNWICIVAGVLLMILAPIGALKQLIYKIQNHKLIDYDCQRPE